MKRILLLSFLALFAVALPGICATVEKSYTIEFATGSSDDGTQLSATSVALNKIFTSNSTNYVYAYSNLATVYYASSNGLRLGSSKNDGTFTMTLKEDAQVIPTKIVSKIAFYGSDKNANFGVGFTSSSPGSTTSVSATEITTNYSGTTPIQYISYKMKRGYIKSVTVYYNETTGEDPVAPADPVLSIEDGSTVYVGDVLTISCATTGATATGMIGNEDLDDKTFPITYTFTSADAAEGSVDVLVAAIKDDLESETVEATYIVKEKTQGETPGGEDKETLEATFVSKDRGIANGVDAGTQTEGVIKFEFEKGTNSLTPKYYTSGESIRLYANNTLTISSTNGANIVRIEINYGGTKNTVNASVGNYTDATANGQGVWTGSATSVQFTNSSGQTYVKSITVYYEGDGKEPDPDIAPSSVIFNPAAGTISTLDAITLTVDDNATKPVTIYYSIDNENYDLTYSAPFSLEAGAHTVYVKASNKSGDYKTSANYTVENVNAYQIIFANSDNPSSDGATYSSTNINDAIEKGKEYADITNYSSAYFGKSGYGVKLGTGSSTGSVTLELTEKGQVYATELVFNAASYNTGDNASLKVTVNDGEKIFTQVLSTTDTDLHDYIFSLGNGVDIKKIKFESTQKRANVKGITIHFSEKEPDVTEAPGMPVVKIGEETLEDGESKVVAKGTKLTITCEGATSITGTYNNIAINLTETPFEYPVNENGTLKIYGKNTAGDGKTFTYTFTIGEVDPNMPAVGSTFKQILGQTFDNELVTGKYYVIGRKESNLLMGKEFDSSGRFKGIENVEFADYEQKYYNGSDAYPSRTLSLVKSTEDVLILQLVEGENGQMGLKTVNYGDGFTASQRYITGSDATTNLTLSETFAPVYINKITNSNNVDIKFVENGNYKLGKGQSNIYFNNQQNPSAIQLYKYSGGKRFEHDYSNLLVKSGTTTEIVVDGEQPEQIIYRVKGNTSCITIEGNVITAQTIKKADVATVTAEWSDTDEWLGNVIEFDVTVRYPAELAFRHGTDSANPVRGKKGVGVVWQAAYYTGDGTLTYSCDSEDIKVDSKTGQIRPIDINNAVADGKTLYKITATVTGETNSYVEDEACYYIVIEAPDAPSLGEPTSTIYESFGANGDNINDLQHFNPVFESSAYSKKEGKHTSLTTNIEYTEKGTYIYQNSKKYFLQFSKDDKGYLSFTLPQNCVSMTFEPGDGVSANSAATIYVDDVEVEHEFIIAGGNQTYTFEGDQSGKKITISTALLNRTVRIASITFNIAQPKTDEKEAELSFADDARIVNVFVGEEVKLPELKHNTNLVWENYYTDDNTKDGLSFDIDEINEYDEDETAQNYTIEATGYNDIKVTVNDPGVYTFRAQYKGDDFLNGMAILRLNVFPRLSVAPTESDIDGTLSSDKRTDHPQLTLVEPAKDDDGDFANIVLPSIAELKDDFKYSTVKVTVTVKHGDDVTDYDENSEMPGSFKFTEDGSVTYNIVYGDYEAFNINETVHVVLMPQVPARDALVLTPSQNARIQYKVWVNGVLQNAKKRAADDEWKEGEVNEPVTLDLPDGYYKVEYRSAKDISALKVADDPMLYSPSESFNNMPTGVDVIEADGEAEYFTVDGLKVASDKLEKGTIYIVVKNGEAVKVVK